MFPPGSAGSKMLWLPLTLLSAFSQATTDALTKRALTRSGMFTVAWLRSVTR